MISSFRIDVHICICFHSLCGFSDALTFIDFDDADIDYVENTIKIKKREFICEKMNPQDFFGPFFYDRPIEFEFARGEKKKMKAIGTYINSVLKEQGIKDGSNYFSRVTENSEDKAPEQIETLKQRTRTHFFLNKLTEQTNQNENREPGGYRYSADVKMYSSLLYMISGKFAYEIIQRNLVCALPSPSSVNRYIRKSDCHIIEGILRPQELLIYLKDRKLPLVVALSEDGTKIVGRVQYDSKTNQVVGLVLPINNQNGLPIPFTFKARNASEIAEHFAGNNENAVYVNVIMAQPISPNRVPPFCLLIYSTDNKYTSRNVCQRWTFIVSKLKELDIQVLAFSSDSDTKYNRCMRNLSSLGIKSNYFNDCDWFYCGNKEFRHILPVYIQDVPHTAARLRTFFLKTIEKPHLLEFGSKYFIQQSHVQYLLDNFSKDKHNLTTSVIHPIDRQNFEDSVTRLCDEKVINLLRSSVVGSQATIKYLEIVKSIIDSFMNVNLTPLERVSKIWYPVLMFRIWRSYVVAKKNLTLKNNYLTIWTYICIELNAHSLLLLILYLKHMNLPQYFLVHFLNSQPCESLFRQVRSFTSTYSTMANCSVKEILGRMSKIELQNEISFHLSSDYHIPRVRIPTECGAAQNDLPDEEQIINEIEQCKKNAIEDALKLGLILKKQVKNFDFSCKIPPYAAKCEKRKETFVGVRNELYLGLLTNLTLKNYADQFEGETISELSPYVELPRTKIKRQIVRKASLCWLLRRDYSRISSDRLERVKSSSKKSIKIRTKNAKVVASNKKVKKKVKNKPLFRIKKK